MRGPGLINTDLSFIKRVPVGGSKALELRIEGFNLFNRVNLTQVVSDLSISQFGQATAQSIPRSAQFGLHLAF